jgi:hypothetical protein
MQVSVPYYPYPVPMGAAARAGSPTGAPATGGAGAPGSSPAVCPAEAPCPSFSTYTTVTVTWAIS